MGTVRPAGSIELTRPCRSFEQTSEYVGPDYVLEGNEAALICGDCVQDDFAEKIGGCNWFRECDIGILGEDEWEPGGADYEEAEVALPVGHSVPMPPLIIDIDGWPIKEM